MHSKLNGPCLCFVVAFVALECRDARAQSEVDDDPSVEAFDELEYSDVPPSGLDFARIADDEETIFAVQRKAYLVKERLEVSLLFSALFNDRFVRSYAPSVSLTYHLAESFGVELFGGWLFPDESATTQELLDRVSLVPPYASVTQLRWTAGVGLQWSPIYGKVEVAGVSLGNFSFYVNAGVAMGQTRVQCTPTLDEVDLDPNRGFDPASCPSIDVDAGDEVVYEPDTLRPMAVFGGGFRFYFTERFGLRAEVRDYVFASRVFRPAEDSPTLLFSDTIRNNVYANVGLSILFGGAAE
ncbi:MAG: outer membrane beta-barrel domain-containing protein [Myxococcota bacterium]